MWGFISHKSINGIKFKNQLPQTQMITLLENPSIFKLFSEVSEAFEDPKTLPLLDEELPSHFLPFLKDQSSLKFSQPEKLETLPEEKLQTESTQTQFSTLLMSQSLMAPSKTEIDYFFESDKAFQAQVRKRKRIDSIGSICSTLFEDQADNEGHRSERIPIPSPPTSPSSKASRKRDLIQSSKTPEPNGILTDMLTSLQTKRASSLVEEIFKKVDQGPCPGQEKKRGKKTKEQLKILRCYYQKCKEWNNQVLELISRQTGLSASQLYKWNWDQKNRVH